MRRAAEGTATAKNRWQTPLTCQVPTRSQLQTVETVSTRKKHLLFAMSLSNTRPHCHHTMTETSHITLKTHVPRGAPEKCANTGRAHTRVTGARTHISTPGLQEFSAGNSIVKGQKNVRISFKTHVFSVRKQHADAGHGATERARPPSGSSHCAVPIRVPRLQPTPGSATPALSLAFRRQAVTAAARFSTAWQELCGKNYPQY